MENASKALIMAGGMLLAILIVSLLIYAWSLFSEYQASRDSLADIEDTAKFNEQFANYDREDVQGYELISLVYKIIDYNYRKSSDADAKSNDKYTPITITINFGSPENRKKLCVGDATNVLFTKDVYKQSTITEMNSFKGIIEYATALEKKWGGSDNATKLAKAYNSIFENPKDDNERLNAVKKWNYLSSIKYEMSQEEYQKMNRNEKENVSKYYEYMQFKRSIFKSDSSKLIYDNTTGRITQMVFNFDKIR